MSRHRARPSPAVAARRRVAVASVLTVGLLSFAACDAAEKKPKDAAALDVSADAAAATPPKPAAEKPRGVTMWTYAMAGGLVEKRAKRTCRTYARMQYAASDIRIRLSNAYGATPARITRVAAGTRTALSGRQAVGAVPVTFDGQRSVTIPAHTVVWSDPVDIRVAAGASLAVSTYVADANQPVSFHRRESFGAYCGGGDRTRDAAGSGLTEQVGNRFVDAVVAGKTTAKGTVVWLGDSVGEGSGLPQDSYLRASDVLARQLVETGMAVVNMSVSGQTLARDRIAAGKGASLVHRLDADAVSLPGVRAVVVAVGLNDLRWGATAAAVRTTLTDIRTRLSAAGIDAYVATLTPYKGFPQFSTTVDNKRLAVNAGLRKDPLGYLGVVDAARALDDASGRAIEDRYNIDGMHANAAGQARLAAAAAPVLRRGLAN